MKLRQKTNKNKQMSCIIVYVDIRNRSPKGIGSEILFVRNIKLYLVIIGINISIISVLKSF